MMRLVLDTDVMAAAVASPLGASRTLVRKGLTGEIELAASPRLFLEYEALLLRPERLAAASTTEDTVLLFLNALATLVIPVALDYRWRPSGADPDNDLVLETAISGSADGVATFNLRPLSAAGHRFGLFVGRPGTAITDADAMAASSAPIRLPPDLEIAATKQADLLGVRLDRYIMTTLADQVGAQGEAMRFFHRRGLHSPQAGDSTAALALLDGMGDPDILADDDRLAPPAAENKLGEVGRSPAL